ncbi:MAG: glycogen synthase [Bacteroidetes bacterium]|nr:MAG: glycogen synthase [Bacteroidota bacterium]
MKKLKVLFVNQEVEPYVSGTQLSKFGLQLPQTAQEKGAEVRTFMPKFGVINERRNQLHEVIRLSGLNLVIAGADHPLIIKVASIQALRLQIYFIDNEDYFLRRGILHDEDGKPYVDNDQRALFFAKGVLETVKKLRWMPDIIHCSGWFTSMLPMLVRTAYANDSFFSKVKILTSLYEDNLKAPFGEQIEEALQSLKLPDSVKEALSDANHAALNRMAIDYSDAVAKSDNLACDELLSYASEKGKKVYELLDLENIDEVYQEIYGKED